MNPNEITADGQVISQELPPRTYTPLQHRCPCLDKLGGFLGTQGDPTGERFRVTGQYVKGTHKVANQHIEKKKHQQAPRNRTLRNLSTAERGGGVWKDDVSTPMKRNKSKKKKLKAGRQCAAQGPRQRNANHKTE